jgi:hypothetical protein
MNATTQRMMDYLNEQVRAFSREIEDARIRFDHAVSMRATFETIIEDQEKIDERQNNKANE